MHSATPFRCIISCTFNFTEKRGGEIRDSFEIKPLPITAGRPNPPTWVTAIALIWIGGVMEDDSHAPMSYAATGSMGVNSFPRMDIRGECYENEDVPGRHVANALARPPWKKAWQLFDSKW